MRLNIKVIPNSKQNRIVEEPGRIKVFLTGQVIKGRGNAVLIRYLAEKYYVQTNKISIISGMKSRQKLVQITK